MSARRLRRLFGPDGRTLLIAMDHPAFFDRRAPGLEDLVAVAETVVAAGADGVLLPPASAGRCADRLGSAALVLSVPLGDRRAVDTALRIGADAVKVITFPWQTPGVDDSAALAELGESCGSWGMPLMVETIPGGWQADSAFRTPERLAAAARMAAELGADIVKTFSPGSVEGWRELTHYVPVPVLVLGGDRAEEPAALHATIRDALAGGARGVVIGRNAWGVADPAAACTALANLVHAAG